MRRSIIPAIFALSGAAGLIFEVVWARQLVLVFGNTTQAVSAILTGFFGGMALGSWFGGQLADRVRRPLLLYGALELILSVVVLLTPYSFRLIHGVYRSAFGTLENAPSSLALVRFVLALVALAPATVLMGSTLPTLTRYLARGASGLGGAFTRLYVANTMGAVFGAAAAGFVLIELLGLSGALLAGAGCSATAGAIAIMLDRFSKRDPFFAPIDTNKGRTQPVAMTLAIAPQRRLAFMFAFVSGLTALAYQVLWTRLIASGTGSSTYVFTIILTVFLTGLAMGAVEYKRIRTRLREVVGALAMTQILIAVLACLGMYAINALDSLSLAFLWKALAVVLPATFVMGFSFPAASALIGGEDSEVATQSGHLLAINTAGAIMGSFLIPFFLVPWLGSPLVLAVIAVTNAVTGVLIAWKGKLVSLRHRRSLTTAGGIIAAAVASVAFSGRLFIEPGVVRMQKAGATLFRTAEDEIASVQSGSYKGEKQLWVTGFSMTLLTVDARLMPVLSLMLRPQSETLLAVAFGMGSSFRTSLIAGLRSDAVELVPSVPKMFDTFFGDARAVEMNPRGRIIIADGRNYVELSDRRYDIIIVDPPPPLQSSGVSIISSREFYVASKHRLTKGGVMMQWVPWGPSMSDVKDHIRTFRAVFPDVIVAAGPGGFGFYMFGSESPIGFTRDNMISVLSRPGVLDDISAAGDSPRHDLSGWTDFIPRLVRLEGDEVSEFAGSGALVTDDHPLPEYFLMRTLMEPIAPPLDPTEVRPVTKTAPATKPVTGTALD